MADKIIKSKTINGKELSLESGFLAQQADGSVLARCGDTAVLVTIVVADPREDVDFFPLSVEYEERLYAGGIIKGSRWMKREGRPSDQAILNGRLIDRSVRPLFPKDFYNDVQAIITVLSVDRDNDPVTLGAIATSAAIKLSGLPWNGPTGSVRIGIVNGEFVIDPTLDQLKESTMDLFVSATLENVIMVEMGGQEIPRDKVMEAVGFAHNGIKEIVALVDEFVSESQSKLGIKFHNVEHEMTEEESKEKEVLGKINEYISNNFPDVLLDINNDKRSEVQEEFMEKIYSEFSGKTTKSKMNQEYDKVAKSMVRRKIVQDKKRVDGRDLDEVRPIEIEIKPLNRTHGSAIFKRGQTQALTVATLGSTSLGQLIESMHGEETKRYMHHYNFPPYCTGEVGRVGSPKRREIGHGALAERALVPVIPDELDFPYTIRLVSEILSSNGSSSMASVCGSTLALMDAGVPIKKPVSGIAMGLIKDGEEFIILTDIMGLEDFYGDMDFKVAGTRDGITALQMDVKVPGLNLKILETALEKADIGRMYILDKMLEALHDPREELSEYAPKISSVQIDPSKIGDIIGPGGKIIRGIQEETGTEIDIQETGMVHIAGYSADGLAKAVEKITQLTKEVEVGEVYHARVVRIVDFGAFVELFPGRDGLVHVSELAPGFVKNVEDVVKMNDQIDVKVIGIDDQGKIKLSRKALMGDQRSSGDDNSGRERSVNNSNQSDSNRFRPNHNRRP